MLKPTKLHEDSVDIKKRRYTLRIGSRVPKNAVNLAYYFNKKMSKDSNVLIAEGNKNIIDHKFVEKWITKEGLQTNNDSQFPISIQYNDEDGYAGDIHRRFINWTKVTHLEQETRADSTTTPKYPLSSDFAQPIDRDYFKDGLYEGNEYLMNVEFIGTKNKDVTQPGVALRECVYEKSVDNQSSQSYPFPPTVNYNKDGFSGVLNKNGGIIVDSKFSVSGAGSKQTRTKNFDGKVTPPPSFIENGILWTRTGWSNDTTVGGPVTKTISVSGAPGPGSTQQWTDPSTGEVLTLTYVDGTYNEGKQTTTEHYKGYGISIYWSSSNNMGAECGDYGGHWNEDPKLMHSRYGHSANETSDNDIASDGIWYDNDDARWWYDNSVSGKKIMWIDEWIDRGNPVPPSGYESDDNDGSNPAGYVYGSGAPVWSETPFVRWDGTEQHWYRYTLAFYAGKKDIVSYNRTAQFTGKYGDTYGVTATYEAIGVGTTNTRYRLTQRYSGVLSKPDNKVIQVPCEWKANIDYKGTLRYKWYDWTGSAFYDGSVIKQNAIGNGNPMGSNQLTMYPDDTGILYDYFGKKEVESEYMYITNIYKDNIPLFYRCRLKYKVFSSKAKDPFDMSDNGSVRLLNSSMRPLNHNKYKYAVQLVPVDPTGIDPSKNNLYYVYVYTSFLVTDNFKVVCSYSAYDDRSGLSVLERLKPDTIEPIYTQPFFELNKDYKLTNVNPKQRINYITVMKPNIIPDTRRKIDFNFVVVTTDGTFISNIYSGKALNIEYAFMNERSKFIDRNYIVSPMQNGVPMTAFEILKRDCESQLLDSHGNYDEDKLNDLLSKTFDVEFIGNGTSLDNNKDLVNLFTPQNGLGVISVETTQETGFDDGTGSYTKMLPLPNRYIVRGDKIYPAFQVMCNDARDVKILPPRETDALSNWYPRIQFSHFTQVHTISQLDVKYVYSLPEFDGQEYSAIYGKPYIDIKGEKAEVVNERTIRIKNTPMYVKVDSNYKPINLKVYKTDINGYTRYFDVYSWNYVDGTINLVDIISENDTLLVDYTFEEQSIVYRGFYDDGGNYIDIDINPNTYHTYLDNRYAPFERRKVYDLFNTVIYFFMKPAVVLSEQSDGSFMETAVNKSTLYHKFDDNNPNSPWDITIGSIHLRQTTSLKSTTVIDTRTRGGGVIEGMSDQLRRELEPESDYYFDIGYWDGEPYTENAVVIIRLDKRILKENGGRFIPQEIEEKVNKWITTGVIPIIEYVTTYTKDELPQASMVVEKEYLNTFDYTPTVYID